MPTKDIKTTQPPKTLETTDLFEGAKQITAPVVVYTPTPELK